MAQGGMNVDEALARLDAYRRQIELAGRNLELVEGLLSDTRRARATLEDWAAQEPGRAVMVPLGANTFVHAAVARADRVLLGVGSGYSAERPTAEATAILEKREKELAVEAEQMGQTLFEMRQQAAMLQDALEQAMGPETAQ